MALPHRKNSRKDELFGSWVRELIRRKFGLRVERALPRAKIHRRAIVGIDETQIPELSALVDVRHTRHRQLRNELRETVDDADLGHASGELRDFPQDLRRPGEHP